MGSLVLFVAVCLVGTASAQVTFNGSTTNTAGNSAIPSSGTGGCTVVTEFNNTVANTTTAVASVKINLTHTWDSDLELYLQAPNGQRIALSTGNGGSAANFTNTVFQDGAPSITGGAAPFTGTYAPEGAVGGSCADPAAGTIGTLAAFTAGAGLNGVWKLRINDNAGGDSGAMIAWSITFVAAPDPCVFTCPAAIAYNLDPGACSAVIDYPAPTYSGNCSTPVLTPTTFTQIVGAYPPPTNDALQCGVNPTSHWRAYDLAGTSGGHNFNAGGNFQMVSQNFNTWSASTVQVFVYTYSGTIGTTLNPAQMTLVGQSAAVAAPGFGVNINAPLTAPVTISATDKFVVEHRQIAGGPFGQGSTYNGVLAPAFMSCNGSPFGFPATPTSYASLGYGQIHPINQLVGNILMPGAPILVQTSGLPSGSNFPIGVTNNCFELRSPLNGNVLASCCSKITVKEYPNPIQQLNCNDLVNISLDADCAACIGADDVLEGGPYGCYDHYTVELDKTLPYGNGPWVAACVGPSDIGKTYQVRVTDPETGNKCWGSVKIEDKIAPKLTCIDYTFACNSNPDPYASNNVLTNANFVSTNTPLQIPDSNPAGASATINIPNSGTILDMNLTVNISHTWVGDLDVILTSPSGTTFQVWNNNCAFFANGLIFTYDDEDPDCYTACADYDDGNVCKPLSCAGPGTGSTDFLVKFDGENMQGVWTLKCVDGAGGDVGTINNFALNISYIALAAPGFTVPGVAESCCFDNLSFIDAVVPENCASGLTQTINRKWTARDCSGNTSTCIQKISFKRPTLNGAAMPADYDDIDAPAFHCTDNAYPTPEWIEGQGLQGFPYVFGVPSGCNINWDYEDLVIEVCDGTYKIRREWTVIDWCIGDGFTYNQIIKVLDEQGPAMSCPANMTVSSDPFACCAIVNLPDVIIEDNCSQINNISGMIVTFDPYTGEQTSMQTFGGSVSDFPGNNYWDLDTLGAYGWTPCLPQGTHTVTYMAEDDCGNTTSCSFRLTVRDYVPPVASCDETTTVAIGVDDPFDCYGPAGPNGDPAALTACAFAGVTWVKATTFNDGSYDQCNNVKFTIRRQAPYSDCILGLNTTNGHPSCDDVFPDFPSEFERAISEQDSIKFYCCEVGTTQTITLRVYQTDVNGNLSIGADGTPIFNECNIQVEVQDKLKPICVPPANVTVTCEQFDPSLWLYGKAAIYDNCCLDETKVFQGQCGLTHAVNYAQFDTLCNKGTITRTFRAFDCHGNSSQCTQRVVVTYEQDYFVKFPNDVIVSTCDGSGVYGEPTFYGEDCELLGVSYEDQIFTVVPDACFKIVRNWKIINWCTYNPNQVPLCVNVPNPNPNAITNHPTNLPGPIVSPVQTVGDPWKSTIVKINPTDATATNFSTFYDANANCYTYKQVIKIIDTQDPIVECPASPVTICDVTGNDAQLWNASYWWDNANQSHDLCEAPSDICITATDACSGANINIEYQLFLDLDGDGSMETLVNSTQLGSQPGGLGWNNIVFGSASGAGTSRQFDGRPVPTNQKWGFAIQETVSGVNRTACVKFNTFQAQNSYVTPQLPYGTHKIKWFVTDGCGNEAICEYSIVIKDCKAPTVVCLNGLSVNIMPTGMIQMWATDFLQYSEDNCTQTQFLKYAIRKCGQGAGFPVDGQGNPITNVTFNCSELGTQCVELWSIDLTGNADYCETYVIVQDNAGNCGVGNTVNVSGALKTENTDGVEEGNVNITGSVNFAPPFSYFDMTDNAGLYAVSNSVPVASSMTIAPVKDDNPLNGVTTYDLVLISKHILGIQPLGSAYKMIAADANKSNSITTFDIVELRKLVLGIYQELPNNTSWRFVAKSHVFANPSNPFQATIAESISVGQAMSNMSDENFVGVKIGDVNNTAVANSLMVSDDRSVGTLLFDVNDRDVKAGEEFEVSFTAAEKTQGYQMTLNLNGLAVSEIVGSDNVTANNFGVFADALTVSVDGSDAFTVKFRAAKAGKLSEMMSVSSRITKSEAYSLADGRMDVALRFDGKTIAGVGFELYQNQPNPFVNKTFVGFHLPEAAAATLTVYDETGRVVFTQKGDFAKGYNAISLDRALLNTTGVLYYTLETATDAATKKMIQAK